MSSGAATGRTWESSTPLMPTPKRLPDDALGEIMRRVVCEAERVRFRSIRLFVQLALKHLAEQEPLTPQLPWLLCSEGGAQVFYCIQCSDGGEGAVHVHPVRLPDEVSQGRWFGSYDGRCMFVQTSDGNMLVDLRRNQRYKIPDQAVILRDHASPYPINMLAATLSSSPAGEYFGAALIPSPSSSDFHPRQVVFWQKGDDIATDPMRRRMARQEARGKFKWYEDLIYHKEGFYVLNRRENIEVWTRDPEDGKWRKSWLYTGQAGHLIHTEEVVSRYLVEWQEDLFMITKCSGRCTHSTRSFKTYKLVQQAPGGNMNWVEVPDLEGAILFLGRGCSRAYDSADFPKLKEASYFLDDRAKGPGAGGDSGSWSGVPPVIHRCFRSAKSKTSLTWILS